MHESDLNRYKKLQQILLLAAWDMQQAEAAARALEAETENLPLMRALETAMAVCYVRAFTPSTLGTLSSQYEPTTPPDSDLHAWFRERRDKEYAHTDKKSSRVASVKVVGWEGDVVNVMLHEQWDAFPRDLIPAAVDLFQRHRDRLREDGTKIQVLLEGEEKFKGGARTPGEG
jgi:hypothetical protein